MAATEQGLTVPAKIMRSAGVGFADYTVTHRLPEIVSRTLADLAGGRAVARGIEDLLHDVISGARIQTSIFATPTPKWREYVEALGGADWSSLPFLDLELLFYHGLNSLVGYFDHGTDVFLTARRTALHEAPLGPFGSPDATLAEFVRAALFANEADQSQAAADRRPRNEVGRILVDHGMELVARLLRSTSRGDSVHVMLDNAGTELVADLALVDAILSLGDAKIVLHGKPWPMFVSDALVSDVDASIHHMMAHGSVGIRDRGRRLATALASGRLERRADAAWGEPRCFGELGDDLSTELRAAAVVIAKGDLGYRRFIEDRAWPADTPVARAIAGVPFGGFALRMLKSEAVVGIPADTIAAATRESREWRTNGRYSVIQWLGP